MSTDNQSAQSERDRAIAEFDRRYPTMFPTARRDIARAVFIEGWSSALAQAPAPTDAEPRADLPGWISVEDQEPPRAVPVLAMVGAAGKRHKQRMAVLEHWTPGQGHDDDEPGWFEPGTRDDFVAPVTHWMPLPAAPKGASK